MAVDPVNAPSGYKPNVNATDSGKDAKDATLNYESFLKLLVAQLKNQDPTEPMDASQQMAQLATFSQVEQTIKTNKNLESLLQRTSLQEASSVMGKTVTSEDGKVTGVVTSVQLYSDGIVATLDSGTKLIIGPGVTIKETAAVTPPPTPDTTPDPEGDA